MTKPILIAVCAVLGLAAMTMYAKAVGEWMRWRSEKRYRPRRRL